MPVSVCSEDYSSEHYSTDASLPDEWQDDIPQSLVCPFHPCTTILDSLSTLYAHTLTFHNCNLEKHIDACSDLYQRIRLVNYLRCGGDVNFAAHLTDDKWLTPALKDDQLLYSLEDRDDDHEKYDRLLQEFASYKINVRDAFLKTHSLTTDDLSKTKVPDSESPSRQLDYYFSSYADSGMHNNTPQTLSEIHEIMLKDTVRTNAYRDYVYANKHLFAGKTVLDVGCGTGILSLFCSRAGAAQVYAVDNSTIISKARAIAEENSISNITFLEGRIEDLLQVSPLANVKVDIIISEWMGYFLLFESMLDCVIRARDVLAKRNPDIIMAPAKSSISIAALSDEDLVNDSLNFWYRNVLMRTPGTMFMDSACMP